MPIGDLLASISGEASPAPSNRPLLPPKRKSSDADSLRRPADKLQKTTMSSLRPTDSSRTSTLNNRPGGVNTSMERMKLSAPGPSNRRQTSQLSTSSSDFKHGQPTPPPTDGATTISKPLKKGSFAEIMARGKQNAEKMAQIGKIQHKRIEKPISKRERAELEAAKAAKMSKNIGPGGKFSNTPGAKAINGKMSAVGPSNGKLGKNGKLAPPEPEKKIKKAALATTGYAGTARPKPGSKPGQKPSHASSSRDRYGRKLPPLGSRLDRYDSYDDEDDMLEDDEEEDDQPDYASDVSSDMEAAAFEVDEEEELAAKIARKEDAEALAEENRLKREKAEKKKKLMAMAAKAGKRR